MTALAPYRQHDSGPLTTIRVEPGAVVVRMEADQWPCIIKMHSHAFDHWLGMVSGSAELSLGGKTEHISAGQRALAASAVTEIQSGLVLNTSLPTNFSAMSITAGGSVVANVGGTIIANIKYVNDVAVTGTGAPGNEWGP